jgi:competence protein ComEC
MMDVANTSHIKSKHFLLIFILILLVSVIYLFYLDFKTREEKLTFAMLDIGQGDSIFIDSPTHKQIIFDAGSAHKILGPLRAVMDPFDRDIDAIVITNPDADHVGGFLEILKNYKVDLVILPGTLNDSKIYQNLLEEIDRQKIKWVLARRGMNIDLSDGAKIEILFPDRDVSLWSTNEGSVVTRLVYGKHSFMLTGDATQKTEEIILKENSVPNLKSEFLKVGHHGSRTSTSISFVKALAPIYALISDGKNNKYGHPHQETLDTLSKFGAKILRTDLLGTIILKCDTMKPCTIN